MKLSAASVTVMIFSVCMSLMGCAGGNTVEASRFFSISDEQSAHELLTWSPLRMDSTPLSAGKKDIMLSLRYDSRCRLKQLPLEIEQLSLDSDRPDTLRVTLVLRNDGGTPLGKNSYGMHEISDTIMRGFTIGEGYTVTVSTPLERHALKGIKSIGVIVRES